MDLREFVSLICFISIFFRSFFIDKLSKILKNYGIIIKTYNESKSDSFLFRLLIWTSATIPFSISFTYFKFEILDSIFISLFCYATLIVLKTVYRKKISRVLISALYGCIVTYLAISYWIHIFPLREIEVFFVAVIVPVSIADVLANRGIVGRNIKPVVLAILLTVLFWIITDSISSYQVTSWILFWTIIPISNALFDWISWTISRWLGNNLLRISEDAGVGPLWRAWGYS